MVDKGFPDIDFAKLTAAVDEPELNARLIYAIENALSPATFRKMVAASDKLGADFIAGKITEAECNAGTDAFRKHVVQFKTIPEFRYALTRVMPNNPALVQECIEHENAHMSTLLSLGLQGTYGFVLTRNEHDMIGVQPHVEPIFPEGMSEDEKRRLSKMILEAPDDLSPSDKAQLGIRE